MAVRCDESLSPPVLDGCFDEVQLVCSGTWGHTLEDLCTCVPTWVTLDCSASDLGQVLACLDQTQWSCKEQKSLKIRENVLVNKQQALAGMGKDSRTVF